MANFSIEWLSKSIYPRKMDKEEDHCAPLAAQVQPGAFSTSEVLSNVYTPTPTSPNNSCGYTSGSDSEQGEDSEGEASLHRRMRTKFTSEQIRKLENTFGRHKYLGATQRRKMADKLNLSETQIKTWFQNRRMKLKRDLQDLRPEYLSAPSGLLQPFLYAGVTAPRFQHHALGGQLPVYPPRGCFPPQPPHRLTFPAEQPHMHPMAPMYYY